MPKTHKRSKRTPTPEEAKRPIVVKFGGSLMEHPVARKNFFDAVTKLFRKELVVVVHGGGPGINAVLEKMKIPAQFVHGRRVTDERTMAVVERVLSGEINKDVVGEFLARRIRAVGISGRDGQLLQASRIRSLGWVGVPSKVNIQVLLTFLGAGFLPVVATVGMDPKGRPLNVNADEAAAAIAAALKAQRLIILTDVPGILNAKGETIPIVHTSEILLLVAQGMLGGGMLPKIKSCAEAIKQGVEEVRILDGRMGSLEGPGTQILP